MDINELKLLQSLPLELKIEKTKARIYDAISNFGSDGLYVSFSGGKDSTVLLDIVKSINENIPAVFCNTGLEYPEVLEFATRKADVVIKPDMNFKDVVSKYGYPVISKEQSSYIYEARTTKSEKLRQLRLSGKSFSISKKWIKLVDADFLSGSKCCDVMKKKPFKKYEKETGRIPILGVMADESNLRTQQYIKNNGCNSFDSKRPSSKPIGFWKEQDILEYIYINKLEIPKVYGDIINLNGELSTTKCSRTGCVFCMYGCHMENDENNRFLRLKETHPNLYNYCMRGGYYDENNLWKPMNGLGMDKVLNDLGVKH